MEVASLVVAIASFIIGVVGIAYAHLAHQAAKQSDEHSKRAEKLSSEAVGVARESNGIAVKANDAAKEAQASRVRAEARETEHHNVRWDGDWPTPGSYVLVNTGDDEALDVKAVVTVDGHEVTVRADSVAAGGNLVFEFPEVVLKLESERARRARMAGHPGLNLWTSGMEASVFVHEDVVWRTALGQQREHRPKGGVHSLADFV